jgi:hypothetical protein
MVECQLGAGVPQRTTVGALWQAMSGRPLSADLLDWPPDLFALTSLVLQRSGAYRFALSPPPGRQWPPGSRSGWSTTVEAAGHAWSGVVDAPGEPVPPLLVSMMEVVVAAATTPLEELSTGADWDLAHTPAQSPEARKAGSDRRRDLGVALPAASGRSRSADVGQSGPIGGSRLARTFGGCPAPSWRRTRWAAWPAPSLSSSRSASRPASLSP